MTGKTGEYKQKVQDRQKMEDKSKERLRPVRKRARSDYRRR